MLVAADSIYREIHMVIIPVLRMSELRPRVIK